MEWSWRTVMILIALLGMAAILVDGFRRMKRNRAEALRLDIAPATQPAPEDDFNPELPGKARVVKAPEDSYNSRFRKAEPIRPVVSAPPADDDVELDDGLASISALDEAADIPVPAVKLSADKKPAPVVDKKLVDKKPVEKPLVSTQPQQDKAAQPVKKDSQPSPIPQSPLIPKARPVNLDEKVPVLLDVEELGDDESFAEGVISAARVVQDKPAAKPAAKPLVTDTPATEPALVDDKPAVVDVVADEPLPVVEDPASINDPHLEQEVEDIPEDIEETPHLVNYAGPNAEVLAQRKAPELVLVIHAIARNPDGFRGSDLLWLFNSCDLRYGEKDIFHRFEEAGGEGCIQFSVAQMRNPGIFDPAQMGEQRFSGLSFFMSLPGAKRPLEAYEAMSEMAMAVSRNLKADVLDGTHSAMTPQTMEHERQQILDYERQKRLAAKKQKV